jgi:hypothetical protein
MKLNKGLAWAVFGINTSKSIAAMTKIFVLMMKNEIRFVTGENLLSEMMKYKACKDNENQVTALAKATDCQRFSGSSTKMGSRTPLNY